MSRLLDLWRALRRRAARDTGVDDELRFHLEMLSEEHRRAGMSARDADAAARRALGNVTATAESSREVWQLGPFETVASDVRYAARFLRRSPWFTGAALLSLAIGIGATTAVFQVVNAVLLEPLPVEKPRELYSVGGQTKDFSASALSVSHLALRRLEQAKSFTSIAGAAMMRRLTLKTANGEEEIPRGVLLVSGKYFGTLGVRAWIGRSLGPEDDVTLGGHPVVVLSHRYWSTRFGSDPSVVGRTLVINDAPFTVVGILPPAFFGTSVGQAPAMYMPLMMDSIARRGPSQVPQPTSSWISVIGRMAPGVDPRRASAELTTLWRATEYERRGEKVSAESRDFIEHMEILAVPAASGFGYLREQFQRPLWVLLGMVIVMLATACANVATLLVARSSARRRELAVRISLGAGRRRLLQQLLTESAVLALLGGVLGLVVASWGSRTLVALAASGSGPLFLDIHPDARMLGVALGLSALTAMLVGLLPALESLRADLTPALKSGTAASRGGSGVSLAKSLVIVQVALSLLLVAGATLFTRNMQRLYSVPVGFRTEQLVLVRLNPSRSGYTGPAAAGVYSRLLEQARAIPGVTAVTVAQPTPFSGDDMSSTASLPGYTPPTGKELAFSLAFVGPDYFATMGQRMVAGRDLAASDRLGAPKVAVINESLARTYFPGRSPIGSRVHIDMNSMDLEIIGVAADTKRNSLRDSSTAMVYMPFLQRAEPRWGTIVMRAQGSSDLVAAALRREITTIDPRLEVLDVATMTAQVDQTIVRERLVARLSTLLGVAALLLASVGLYGVMTYAVARRTSEIGLRVALGAEPGRVARGVLRETLTMVAIGAVFGIPLSLGAMRLAKSLLFDLTPGDPVTLGIAVGMLAAVALLAAWMPARRAARVDPLVALRAD